MGTVLELFFQAGPLVLHLDVCAKSSWAHALHSRCPNVKAAAFAGRQPLGVSTLAENAAPQKLGDVGGLCAADGFLNRYVPARAGLSVCITGTGSCWGLMAL